MPDNAETREPEAECINCGQPMWRSSTGWTHGDPADSRACGNPAIAHAPKERPSFSITFDFTDFTPDGNFDQEAFAEAVFDLLASGPEVLNDFNYSIDGWDRR